MGFGSPLHWLILIAVIVLLFGSGRVSTMMGDVAKGIKSFKKGLAEEDEPTPPRRLTDERTIDSAPRATEAPAERGAAPETDRH